MMFSSQNLVFANATLGMMPPPDSWGPNHCMAAEAPHTQWLKPSEAAAANMAAARAAGASLAPPMSFLSHDAATLMFAFVPRLSQLRLLVRRA
jgi:hypothetical protein